MVPLKSIFSEKQRQQLVKDAPTPLYFQLYTLLKSCIVDGTFQRGMRLPTEKELSDEFGISRITAKRALDELAGDNLVERRRGKGTHVRPERAAHRSGPLAHGLEGILDLEEMTIRAEHGDGTVVTRRHCTGEGVGVVASTSSVTRPAALKCVALAVVRKFYECNQCTSILHTVDTVVTTVVL